MPTTTIVLVDHLEFEMENVDTNVRKVELLEEIIRLYRGRVVLLSGAEPLSSFALRCDRKSEPETSQEDYTSRWKAVLSGCTRLYFEEKRDQGTWQGALSKGQVTAQPYMPARKAHGSVCGPGLC